MPTIENPALAEVSASQPADCWDSCFGASHSMKWLHHNGFGVLTQTGAHKRRESQSWVNHSNSWAMCCRVCWELEKQPTKVWFSQPKKRSHRPVDCQLVSKNKWTYNSIIPCLLSINKKTSWVTTYCSVIIKDDECGMIHWSCSAYTKIKYYNTALLWAKRFCCSKKQLTSLVETMLQNYACGEVFRVPKLMCQCQADTIHCILATSR